MTLAAGPGVIIEERGIDLVHSGDVRGERMPVACSSLAVLRWVLTLFRKTHVVVVQAFSLDYD